MASQTYSKGDNLWIESIKSGLRSFSFFTSEVLAWFSMFWVVFPRIGHKFCHSKEYTINGFLFLPFKIISSDI